MKILQVCPRYYPHIGGVEEHVRNISERLIKRYDVSVFSADLSHDLARAETINGVEIRRFRSWAPKSFSPAMIRELRSAEFDVVHAHNCGEFPVFFARYATRKKFIITTCYHGPQHTIIGKLQSIVAKPLAKSLFRDADRIICLTDYEKNLLISNLELERDKIIVLPNGVNLKQFSNLKRRQECGTNVLCVARLERYKGVQYLIRALSKTKEDLHLSIVGNGPYKAKLVRLVGKLGLRNKVMFYPNLSREKILEMYAHADLFAILSRYETFCISVAEALASKIPCIVADISALSEWIDDENCFGVSYPIDVDELARLMDDIIGREIKGVKIWDWNDVVSTLEHVYEN